MMVFDPKQLATHFLSWSTWFDPVDSVLVGNDNSPKLTFYPGQHGLTRIDPVDSVLVGNDGFDPKQLETHFLPWSTWFDPVDLVLMERCG